MFYGRKGKLEKLPATEDDIFRESASLLDFLLWKHDISQEQVDRLWDILINDCREWQTDATEHDKQTVAGTVFEIVRATLAQHYDSRYSETICDMLISTLERKRKTDDAQEQADFLQQLLEQTPALCEWINSYDEATEWLSDQIADIIASKNDKEEFSPSGKTFTKTTLLTDTLIDIMGQRLTKAGKLEASPDDWRKLFSGIDQKFDMTWRGTGGELRDLFKMLKDNGYITPKQGYQLILKSHFLDEEGKRFNNIHGDKSINNFQPIIDDCTFLLQHLTDSMTELMKQLMRENEAALQEAGYYNNVQAAKQAGLRIKNKGR